MINVLMVSTFGPNIRGISPYADDLADALKKSKQLQLKLVDYKSPFPAFLLPKGTNYNADNNFACIDYRDPRTWRLDKEGIWDIVHLQYWSPAFLPVLLILINKIKNKNTKIIITWHNPKPHEKIPFIQYLESMLTSRADGIIFHNENDKLDKADTKVKNKCIIIHHGCRIAEHEAATTKDYQRCNLQNNREYIIFFGNIRPYKGLEYLLDAWQIIKNKFPNTDLIIAGKLWEHNSSFLSKVANKVAKTTDYSTTIRNLLSQNDNKQIITDLEFIEEDKLNSYLKISKLAIFPYSQFESQSGAAMRAIGNKIPIITTDIGGLSKLVIDKSFIFQSCSSLSLAKTIENCLSTYSDKMRNLQLKKANQFSWDSAAKEHINFYKKITSI